MSRSLAATAWTSWPRSTASQRRQALPAIRAGLSSHRSSARWACPSGSAWAPSASVSAATRQAMRSTKPSIGSAWHSNQPELTRHPEVVMSRVGIFLYGLACYALFLGVFVYAIGFIGGFYTPTSLDGAPGRPLIEALAIDLGLLALFAIQHSVMARPAFKRWWTRVIPEAAERSTYVLASSLALVALFAFWEPIGGLVWDVSGGAARAAMIGLYVFGWALLLYTTFLIDHFDLFGLAQVWRNLTGKNYRPPQFRTPSLYRVVRHPLYVGWLVIFWAAR